MGSGPSISGPCRPRCRPTANTSPHILDSTRVVEDRHTLRATRITSAARQTRGRTNQPHTPSPEHAQDLQEANHYCILRARAFKHTTLFEFFAFLLQATLRNATLSPSCGSGASANTTPIYIKMHPLLHIGRDIKMEPHLHFFLGGAGPRTCNPPRMFGPRGSPTWDPYCILRHLIFSETQPLLLFGAPGQPRGNSLHFGLPGQQKMQPILHFRAPDHPNM